MSSSVYSTDWIANGYLPVAMCRVDKCELTLACLINLPVALVGNQFYVQPDAETPLLKSEYFYDGSTNMILKRC